MRYYCVESRWKNGEHISGWTRHSWHHEKSHAERFVKWSKENYPSRYEEYRIVSVNK